ncbi:uncharacterized protein LOC117908615 isoform X2 [Vitis riparia]|uniref:uncharacterized protein LOC117908615 isoform X2 n=1 Tax=Vitis riparia TaxID=96939 RepID=UPI00155A1A2C|nr:uncharacterized protein LOC117908615 isoform X2 [Vitis riparia]
MPHNFTCLDVTQCLLNKTILNVAAKYIDSDISGCLGSFLALGTKASMWCGKHLKMTLLSIQESQEEEHCTLFFQLLLDFFSFSAASFSALARYPVSEDKELIVIVERFILEQLNLAKDSISEVKRTHSFGSEVLKVVQVVLDAVVRLCRVYSQAVNWELCDSRTERSDIDCEEANSTKHVINIIKCIIEKMCELGILAANDGGNLVTILNLSWKGVVTLLQLGKGALAVKVNVPDIILTLISLANESLRCAAEAWSSRTETITAAEAKRTFLPVKFYLINAVRISSQYPCQAYLVYREIILCVLMISTLGISLSIEKHLKTASEVLAELLEPTYFHLLNALLNSAQVKQELKFQILDWLFIDEHNSNSSVGDPSTIYWTASMDTIFTISCEAMPGARILLLSRVALFLNILKSSRDLEEDVRLGIARKLGWLLDVLVDEEVYSSVLVLQVPILYGSGQTLELVWQPMFSTLILSLKTFMIVVSPSPMWSEFEFFLLQNFFHPHFLCWEIVMELWCFMVRHAEIEMVVGIIDKLCSLLKSVASIQPVLAPSYPLRKMARSICKILSSGTESIVDQVYSSIVGDDRSQLSLVMHIALLMEGFPLNLLSDSMKSIATRRIMTDYFGFIDSFDDKTLQACSSGVFGLPVFALSAALQSIEVKTSDIDTKTLRFLVAIIQKYRSSMDNQMKDHCRKLLSETLGIVSNMKHLYASDAMEEVILELQNLFISGQAASDTQLYECKPDLASFLAGLAYMKIVESDKNAKSSAVWELYRMLLSERHWAFVHLAITAFGYFSGRTSCDQLWRFVPQNAALSFDLESGDEANEERFTSEFKAFLDKEMTLTVTPSSEQLGLHLKEGLMLKEMVLKISKVDTEAVGCEIMKIDNEKQANKRRKLPDGISKGMEMLQHGLKVMGDGISEWQQNNFDQKELHNKFLAHYSSLKDVIDHLVGLAGSG